ncbi:hypothetical protein AAFC00_002200 [Neodothiora populina]|uniref:Carbohydrate kinase PfkB domain-containing protein n=1 Tax=Neodothiora populina TaxID=2781224 RepID=A0ABR3PGL7_9PEZI
MAQTREYEVDFCTLGMFIIDDIYPSPSEADQTPRLNVIGGAGTYSAIGARVLSPPPLSSRVGWIVDCGTDFPDSIRTEIAKWDTGVLMRQRDGLTTKGWNGYGANEHRAFKYLTPKLRLTHLDPSPELLSAKSFHLICSASRSIELVEGVLERRGSALGQGLPRPLFIWEPVPDLCVPSELNNTIEALKYIDVISPNHAELASLFAADANAADGHVDKAVVEECSKRLLEGITRSDGNNAPAHKLAVVVRSGRDGCYVRTSGNAIWFPAFHTDSSKVIDPTGGGNGFLGGLAVGLVRSGGDVYTAALWGNVAASLAIEQVGVPVLGPGAADGKETWNGVVAEERLREMEARCHFS